MEARENLKIIAIAHILEAATVLTLEIEGENPTEDDEIQEISKKIEEAYRLALMRYNSYKW